MRALTIITLAPLMLLAVSSSDVPASMTEASDKAPDIGKPVISFEYVRGVLVIWGLYESDNQAAKGERPPGDLTYTLTVEKMGDGGTSKTSQSGTFRPSPASNDTLASVRMRVPSDASVFAELTISHDDSPLETVEETWTGP